MVNKIIKALLISILIVGGIMLVLFLILCAAGIATVFHLGTEIVY